ncbi:MAG: alpha-L-arabinofuranosidase [Lachnospiraceae bacterium]|jgi:alpha-L-arabinofuranosidase|nr:alpha-L-arabinofuranosidase [Lachnospiraceae bacterium]
MKKTTEIYISPNYQIGEISPRLFGAFLEPIGTMVNGSMYNPGHPSADAQGFRGDFMEALKTAGLPAIRMPGGNFVSGWNWKDSIGPKEARKTHPDLAWRQYYTNDVGHDEFLSWAEKIGAEALYTLNLGTGSLQDAVDLVEYTNHPSGTTYWSSQRIANGHTDPYGVKVWYLGNEMDGPWQTASWEKDPKGFGILTNEVSKAMKWVDPSIKTATCVSCSQFLPHYPEWDRKVLKQCYETTDYISLHHYHDAPLENMAALMGGSRYYENYINTEIALCDFLQAGARSPRKIMLSFDEYSTMARPCRALHPGTGGHALYETYYDPSPDKKYVLHDPGNMDFQPFEGMLPQMLTALTDSSCLLAFMRHADRVKIACNTNGILSLAATDRMHVWRPAQYYPYEDLIRYAKGISLLPSVDTDKFDIPGYAIDDNQQYSTQYGIPFIDTAAAWNSADGELNVFVINRDWENDREIRLHADQFPGYRFVEQTEMYTEDLSAADTFDEPETIVPRPSEDAVQKDGCVVSRVRKLSWNVFRFKETK